MTDLGAIFDEHVRAEFELKDADAAVATMTDDAYLIHVPVGTGANGREALRQFYAEHFIPGWPDDTSVTPIARTVGDDRVVDELVVSCTHSRVMDHWLPGIAPTGRRIEAAHVVVTGFRGDKIRYEHVYWDHASVLAQIGLVDAAAVPVLGAEQAHALEQETATNVLIERAERAEGT
jgi:carboxymethylenebutenolidase